MHTRTPTTNTYTHTRTTFIRPRAHGAGHTSLSLMKCPCAQRHLCSAQLVRASVECTEPHPFFVAAPVRRPGVYVCGALIVVYGRHSEGGHVCSFHAGFPLGYRRQPIKLLQAIERAFPTHTHTHTRTHTLTHTHARTHTHTHTHARPRESTVRTCGLGV